MWPREVAPGLPKASACPLTSQGALSPGGRARDPAPATLRTDRNEAGDEVGEGVVGQVPGAEDQLLGLVIAGQLQWGQGGQGRAQASAGEGSNHAPALPTTCARAILVAKGGPDPGCGPGRLCPPPRLCLQDSRCPVMPEGSEGEGGPTAPPSAGAYLAHSDEGPAAGGHRCTREELLQTLCRGKDGPECTACPVPAAPRPARHSPLRPRPWAQGAGSSPSRATRYRPSRAWA